MVETEIIEGRKFYKMVKASHTKDQPKLEAKLETFDQYDSNWRKRRQVVTY